MPVSISGRKARGQVRRLVPWAHPALAPWVCLSFPFPEMGGEHPSTTRAAGFAAAWARHLIA